VRLAPSDFRESPERRTAFWLPVSSRRFLDACQRYVAQHPAVGQAPLVYTDETPSVVYLSGPRHDDLQPDVVVGIYRYLYDRFVASDDVLLGVRVWSTAFVLVVRDVTVVAVLLAHLPHPTFEPIAELLPPVLIEDGI
jgi:hypothetical protein